MSNLKFISTGSTTVTLNGNGLPNSFTANGSAYTMGSGITLENGEYVEFAGSTDDFSKDGSHYYQFSIGGTGTVEVEGDLISLINNNAFVKQYQFINLFKNCSKITSIANLNFPASIADFCYSNMFAGCTGLVNGGTTLPATATTRWCYNGMFAYCSSMTTPPTILATKIAPFCYYQMFVGCTSLTNGPQLYNSIVEGRMNSNCMFKDCSSLSSIKVSFTTWPAESDQNQSKNWLNGVAETGVLKKLAQLTIPSGVKPESWTIETWQPPTITLTATIPTFSFDAKSETDIVSSLLDYATYTGEFELNCQVEGELPAGITENNGVLTGVPSQLESDFSDNFNVIYSAVDVPSTLPTTMPLQIINTAPDYSTLPMTFECVSGEINLSLPLYQYRDKQSASSWNGNHSKLCSMFYKKTGDRDWTDWKALNYTAVPLTAGQKIEISGQNYGNMGSSWGDYVNRFELNGTGEAILYGNISSLFRTDVETVRIMNIMLAQENGDYILTDASKFIIPYKTDVSEGLNVFCRYSRLRGGPLFTTPTYSNGMFSYQFENCSNLMCFEANFRYNNYWSFSNFFYGVNTSNGLFIKPQSLYMSSTSKGVGICPSNWIVLNRTSDGKLYYATGSDGQSLGNEYKDEYGPDPYAWYYAFHTPISS